MINQGLLKYFHLIVLVCLSSVMLHGQDSLQVKLDSASIASRGTVRLGNETLFFLYESSAVISAKERAGLANQRIAQIADKVTYDSGKLYVKDSLDGSFIIYDSLYLVKITLIDAYGEGLVDRNVQARIAMKAIKESIAKHRATTGIKGLIREIGIAIMVVLIFIMVVFLTNRLFRYLKLRVRRSNSVYLDSPDFRESVRNMRNFFVCKNDKETPPLLKDWGPKVYFCVALRCVALRCVCVCVALRCVALRCVALRF